MGATSTKRDGIYYYDRIFEAALRRLKSTSDIKDADKSSFAKLVEHLLAKGISKQRAVKYVNHLLAFARIASEPLGRLDRKDMEKLIGRINGSRYSENTKHDIKVIIKKYFQWLRECDENEHEYLEEVRRIKASLRKKRLMPQALLTTEELKMLVEATENQRDRAFILTRALHSASESPGMAVNQEHKVRAPQPGMLLISGMDLKAAKRSIKKSRITFRNVTKNRGKTPG